MHLLVIVNHFLLRCAQEGDLRPHQGLKVALQVMSASDLVKLQQLVFHDALLLPMNLAMFQAVLPYLNTLCQV
jgi:hypothetical protein